jgi:hypothetical protein
MAHLLSINYSSVTTLVPGLLPAKNPPIANSNSTGTSRRRPYGILDFLTLLVHTGAERTTIYYADASLLGIMEKNKNLKLQKTRIGTRSAKVSRVLWPLYNVIENL